LNRDFWSGLIDLNHVHDLNSFIYISYKIKKIKQKSYVVFEAFCDLYDTFNWYSNMFHFLLKKAETSQHKL